MGFLNITGPAATQITGWHSILFILHTTAWLHCVCLLHFTRLYFIACCSFSVIFSLQAMMLINLNLKSDIHNRASALTITRGLLHHLKMSWTLVHKWLQIGTPILPTVRKFCFLLHCQASLTAWQTLAIRTQPNFVKRWTINCANNLS